jgi:hypothetical protein
VSDEAFEQAIFDHLALAERNKKLERSMPIDRYRGLYGGGIGGAPTANQDDLPAKPDASGFVPDFQWDATAERSLPAFDDWNDG